MIFVIVTCLPVRPSVCPLYLSVFNIIISISTFLSHIYLNNRCGYTRFYRIICLSIHPSIYLSIHPSIYLSIYLSISVFLEQTGALDLRERVRKLMGAAMGGGAKVPEYRGLRTIVGRFMGSEFVSSFFPARKKALGTMYRTALRASGHSTRRDVSRPWASQLYGERLRE